MRLRAHDIALTWALALTLLSCSQPQPRSVPRAPGLAPAQAGPGKPDVMLARLGERIGQVASMRARDYTPGPARRKRARPLRVAVLSDLNGSYGSTTYRAHVHRSVDWVIEELQPDLVLSTGDMVAGMMPGLDYEAMWTAFHRAVTLPLTRANIPFAPTPGNHDAVALRGYEAERAEYARQWDVWRPRVEFVDRAHYPRRYAFLHGGALFISLDATTVGPRSRAHLDWLDEVLSRHRDAPTKIVFGHLPIHPFSRERVRDVLADAELEALLVRHEVDAYLSGHHHAYYPGRRGPLRMISMSCLGGGPRRLLGTDEDSPRSVVVLEIDAEGGISSVEAHIAPRFDERIRRRDLPERVGQGESVIVRDDL